MMKLYGVSEDCRTIKVRSVLGLIGIEVEFEDVRPKQLKKGISPTGKLPVLYKGEELVAHSSNSMVKLAIRESGKLDLLGGKSGFSQCSVDNWLEYSLNSIEHIAEVCGVKKGAKIGKLSGEELKQVSASATDALVKELSTVLEKYLAKETFLVDNKFTVADIALASALLKPFSTCIEPKIRNSKLKNVTRWFETCRRQAEFDKYLVKPFALFNGATGAKKKQSGKASAKKAPVAAVRINAGDTKIKELFRRSRIRIREILHSAKQGAELIGQEVVVCGWQRTIRMQNKGSLAFLELNDGSSFKGIQIVCSEDTTEGFEDLVKAGGIGSSHRITGNIVESPAKGQVVELQATKAEVLGTVDTQAYPLKKTGKSQSHSVEFLREIAHLRPRTNLVGAVARVRNACAQGVHQFFKERGFLYIHTPILTASDCEGAGEMFAVTTMLSEAEKTKGQLPVVSEKEAKESKGKMKAGEVNYSKDFFHRPAFLTVSGQLNVETYACALSDVYTFGPTFRAENSHTSRHLAEFWMIEPELCFATLEDDMNLAEDFLKYLSQYVLDNCPHDMEFFESRVENGLIDRLKNVIESPFVRLTYTEAIKILNQPEHLKAGKFEEKPDWGIDLGSEHERYLTEKVYKKPVILTDYPADIKAFYMRQNPLNEDGKLTVQAMDILVPRIGEIMGGSAREERLDLLEQRIKDMNLEVEHFSWYCDLRKYGTVPHAGFGMGFERLVMYVTGVKNIRDVIPFPRHPGTCEF